MKGNDLQIINLNTYNIYIYTINMTVAESPQDTDDKCHVYQH